MKPRYLALGLLALLCVSCTATLQRKQPWGERVRVSQREMFAPAHDGELLAIDDSMLYYVERGRVVRQPWAQVSGVRVLAYSTPRVVRWIFWLPTLALGIIWLQDTSHPNNHGESWEPVAAVSFSALIMYLTWPNSTFRSPPSAHDRERLRMFSRYPQGLTGEQWQTLLKANGQPDFLAKP